MRERDIWGSGSEREWGGGERDMGSGSEGERDIWGVRERGEEERDVGGGVRGSEGE